MRVKSEKKKKKALQYIHKHKKKIRKKNLHVDFETIREESVETQNELVVASK
jgi:hypothetical protein